MLFRSIDANAQRVLHLTDQLAAMSNQHQEVQAAAAFNAERARLAEWDAGLLRGQIGLVQQDLARARNDLNAALAQAHTQVADLDDRLKASVAAEREASAGYEPCGAVSSLATAARQLSC